jgi:phosphoribosylformylglycinamidine synthase
MVRTDTILWPGTADCALIRIKGTKKAIALTVDGNGTYCYLNPDQGGKIAVAEAARNIVCTGAKPLAITNCLNFGNPTKPAVFWQFRKCIEGMAEACRVLETPVTGGNVSFYNENPRGAIDPTPMIGMLGLLEDVDFYCTPAFKNEGDLIILLGEYGEGLGGSEYLKLIHSLKVGDSPSINLEKEKRVQRTCLEAIRAGLLNSAHDCSEGGLAVALAECCFSHCGHKVGAAIQLSTSKPSPANFPSPPIRSDTLLFGESQSRIVISCSGEDFNELENIIRKNKVAFLKLGEIRKNRLIIKRDEDTLIDIGIDELEEEWEEGLIRYL